MQSRKLQLLYLKHSQTTFMEKYAPLGGSTTAEFIGISDMSDMSA
jgi:hypothetical protein